MRHPGNVLKYVFQAFPTLLLPVNFSPSNLSQPEASNTHHRSYETFTALILDEALMILAIKHCGENFLRWPDRLDFIWLLPIVKLTINKRNVKTAYFQYKFIFIRKINKKPAMYAYHPPAHAYISQILLLPLVLCYFHVFEL